MKIGYFVNFKTVSVGIVFAMCSWSNLGYTSNVPVVGWLWEGWNYCATDQEREGRQLACFNLAKEYGPIVEKAYFYQNQLLGKIYKHHQDFLKGMDDELEEYRFDKIIRMIRRSRKDVNVMQKKIRDTGKDFDSYLSGVVVGEQDRIAIKEPGWYENLFGGGAIRESMDRKRAECYHKEYVKKKEIWEKILNSQRISLIELEKQFFILRENDRLRKNEVMKNKLVDVEGYDLPGIDENTLLLNEHNTQYEGIKNVLKHKLENTSSLVAMIDNTDSYFEKLDCVFDEETELSKNDFMVMALAVVLQVARQNLMLLLPGMNDQKSDKIIDRTFNLPGTYSNRNYGYYNPTLAQVISNPVPYDVIRNSQGRLSGYGVNHHRSATLGHDSLLGLLVGTANIATGTVTTSDLRSYHVASLNGMDAFGNNASTAKVFSHFAEKIFSKNVEDKKVVATAFAKQLIHMLTDLPTKNSLPLPFSGLFAGFEKRWGNNPIGLGNKLSSIGSNTTRFVVSGGGAFVINRLIEWLHYALCFDGSMSENLFAVKTRKILCYSNLIASGANIGESLVLKNPKLVDLSGYLISLAEIITSVKFARQVKRDFVFGKYDRVLIQYCCEDLAEYAF